MGCDDLVYVEVRAGSGCGIGFTYADVATAKLHRANCARIVLQHDALEIGARWNDMYAKTRNLGHAGITSMAVSAVDVALWDLKGKLLGRAGVATPRRRSPMRAGLR